ncbi:hypothetical protein [Gordonia sp. CPCC 205333]|uniref:hypothetical protein n=1 Tax=Gordonia sp. CPCC 205333 TaxID=3140790 RepID=UPI003AF37185
MGVDCSHQVFAADRHTKYQVALETGRSTIAAANTREYQKWRREQAISMVIEIHTILSRATRNLGIVQHRTHEFVDDWPIDVVTGRPVTDVEMQTEIHSWMEPAIEEATLLKKRLELVATPKLTDLIGRFAPRSGNTPALLSIGIEHSESMTQRIPART